MEEKQDKKITLGFVLGWIFGALALVGGLGSILSGTGTIIWGLLHILMAIILLPPANTFIANKFKFVMSGGLKVILVLVLLTAIGVEFNKTEDEDFNIKDTKKETEVTEEVEEEVKKEEEVEQDWVKVASITANTDEQSDTFKLEGGKQKIVYSLSGDDLAACSIYLVKEGSDIMGEDGSIPVVIVTETISGETIMRKGKGSYYIKLLVANTTCEVDFYEYRQE